MTSASPSASSLAAAAHRRHRRERRRHCRQRRCCRRCRPSILDQGRRRVRRRAGGVRRRVCQRIRGRCRCRRLRFEGVCVSAFADGADAADVALSRCRHRRSLRAACLASLNWTMRTCLRGKRKPGRLHRKQTRDAIQNGLIESGN